jgi:hypothetical protein
MREGVHPTISLASPEKLAWHEYFDRHLGGRPLAFQMFLDGGIREMTLPEQLPQWFDPSFTTEPGWQP